MSNEEMRAEAIRLIDEINEDRLEHLLACLRVFRAQQDFEPCPDDTTELNKRLEEGLEQARKGELIPNSQVMKDINDLLANLKKGVR